jgi:hypothetical protein
MLSLVGATQLATTNAAWANFINSHNKLLLHVARSLGGDYDAVMFSTWPVVVAQRICLDHYRHRYGRNRHPAASVDTARDWCCMPPGRSST